MGGWTTTMAILTLEAATVKSEVVLQPKHLRKVVKGFSNQRKVFTDSVHCALHHMLLKGGSFLVSIF